MGYEVTNTAFNTHDDPCIDKLAFTDEKQANAARVQADWEHNNQKLKAYKCKKCDLYHLSTDHDS